MAEDNIIEFNPTLDEIAEDLATEPISQLTEKEINEQNEGNFPEENPFKLLYENPEVNEALINSVEMIRNEIGIEIPRETLLIIGTIFALPEESFEQLAPSFLNNFEETFNNSNEKLALCQSMNISNIKAEDLVIAAETWNMTIEKSLGEQFSEGKRNFLKRLFGIIIDAAIECNGISKRIVRIPYKFCNDNAKLPEYANNSDAGADIFSIEEVVIEPGETKLVRTGLKVAIPEGYEIQIRPRSGLSARTKLRIANAPGTIDAGYRDEICVVCENIDSPIRKIHYHFDEIGRPIIDGIDHGSPIIIGKGEKIAQMVLSEVPKMAFYDEIEIESIGENRGGGFGSTGV